MNFEKRILRAMKHVSKGSKILLAMSGGKDSVVAGYWLKRLGYNVEALHIHLGISHYSDVSLKKAEEQAEALDIPLHLVFLQEISGKGIDDFPKGKRCRFCGIAKRYLMNKFAFEKGFDVLATGHNMDDELAFYWLDVSSGNVENFLRRDYYLPGDREKRMVAKVKPLYFLTDKEIKAFADRNSLPYLTIECPNKQSTQIRAKEAMEAFDRIFPIKFSLLSFNRKIRKRLKNKPGEAKVVPCKHCGYPSLTGVCSFCKYFLNRK